MIADLIRAGRAQPRDAPGWTIAVALYAVVTLSVRTSATKPSWSASGIETAAVQAVVAEAVMARRA